MNQKLIVAIAVVLILIGGVGIFIFSGKSNERVMAMEEQRPHSVPLVAVDLVIARQALKAGMIIRPEYIIKQRIELEPGQWLPEEQEAGKEILTDFVVLEDIAADSRLRSNQVARPGSPAFLARMVAPGYSAWMFMLDGRQQAQLATVKSGEYVDIYFRYHMDIPDYKTEIKTDPAPEIKRIGRFNGTRILPLFKNKKMIYQEKRNGLLEDISSNVTNLPQQKNTRHLAETSTDKDMAHVYIELDEEDIKKIYSIDAYGSFILLPSSFGENQSLSTGQILPETIRQLKGKKQDGK